MELTRAALYVVVEGNKKCKRVGVGEWEKKIRGGRVRAGERRKESERNGVCRVTLERGRTRERDRETREKEPKRDEEVENFTYLLSGGIRV